jgi:hypothetical protein
MQPPRTRPRPNQRCFASGAAIHSSVRYPYFPVPGRYLLNREKQSLSASISRLLASSQAQFITSSLHHFITSYRQRQNSASGRRGMLHMLLDTPSLCRMFTFRSAVHPTSGYSFASYAWLCCKTLRLKERKRHELPLLVQLRLNKKENLHARCVPEGFLQQNLSPSPQITKP